MLKKIIIWFFRKPTKIEKGKWYWGYYMPHSNKLKKVKILEIGRNSWWNLETVKYQFKGQDSYQGTWYYIFLENTLR